MNEHVHPHFQPVLNSIDKPWPQKEFDELKDAIRYLKDSNDTFIKHNNDLRQMYKKLKSVNASLVEVLGYANIMLGKLGNPVAMVLCEQIKQALLNAEAK